ncbi:MAG: hypothetical protein ACI977_000485 [Candidatus Nanohaloarchaea archaeon]|jgi:hypothetical protein
MADDKEVEDAESNEEQEEVAEEEIVEEIEEETAGGLLGSFSSEALLAGGIIFGIALGLITGYGLASTSTGVQKVSPGEVQDTVETLVNAAETGAEVKKPEVRNGLYYVTVESEQQFINQTTNETQTRTVDQNYYITLDNELLFIVREQLGQQVNPINVQDYLERIENQSTGNQTE